MNLLTEVRKLVLRSALTREQIAKGAGVERDWLNAVTQGRIRDPGVTKIQKLHDFLTAQQE
jgi:transcriptional regulator with XRE-family HTH domain